MEIKQPAREKAVASKSARDDNAGHDAETERGSMSRNGPTASASPQENFGRPARRLLLRLIEPRLWPAF
jgi:hypothetical protein